MIKKQINIVEYLKKNLKGNEKDTVISYVKRLQDEIYYEKNHSSIGYEEWIEPQENCYYICNNCGQKVESCYHKYSPELWVGESKWYHSMREHIYLCKECFHKYRG